MARCLLLTFLGLGAFLLFVFFSYLVHKDFFTHIDFSTTVRLQDKIPRRFDEFFSFLSLIGNFEVMLGVLLVILIFARKIIGGFSMLLAFAGFHLFEIYGKTFVDHLPPPEFMIRTKKLIDMPQFHIRLENSYPSGHAARAAFVTLVVALLVFRSKKIGQTQKVTVLAILALYDVIMFTSRIYLGEHWASDVIGGLLLGASSALAAGAFF